MRKAVLWPLKCAADGGAVQMELGGNLPHGESLIVVKLQHLLLPLRQHLAGGQSADSAAAAPDPRSYPGRFPAASWPDPPEIDRPWRPD